MTVFCGSCGTEVEEDALFCPACGEPISAAAPELPPAPDWPEPPARPAAPRGEGSLEPAGEPDDDEQPSPGAEAPRDAVEASVAPGDVPDGGEPAVEPAVEPGDEPSPGIEPPPGVEPGPEPRGATRDAISTAPQAVPPWRRGAVLRGSQAEGAPSAPGDAAEAARAAGSPEAERPQPRPPQPPPARPRALAGAPTTLSGWLIGGGSVVGLLALFLPWITGGGSYVDRWGLAYGINVLVLIALVAVAAVIFAADVIPAFPRRNLAILAVTLVGVGIGLDRGTQPFAQFGAVIFLLAMLVATAGALLVELEMDRPMGPTGGPQA